MALLSLLQRTTSTLLPSEIKEKSLSLILKLNKLGSQFALIVHSQLVLTAMTMFEVYQLDILEHLQKHFDQLMNSFDRVKECSKGTDFFSESFIRTLLKSTLSVITFFSKFITADQYEQIIKNVIVITDKTFNEDVKSILDVISKEATKNVGFKLVF